MKQIKGFIPSERRVLVKLIEEKQGSIIMNTQPRKDMGVVVGRGEECKKRCSELGTKILFNPLGTKDLFVDGQTVIMINEDQIYGRYEDEK